MIFEKNIIRKYKRIMLRRRDPDGSVLYFTRDDFDGLISEDISFLGDRGQRLFGHFYYRGKRRTDRLIMFDHGMGCGHIAYMREINLLTERGYTVFTYDHTGTLSSEGDGTGGFSQSLSDLDHAMKFVRSISEYKDTEIAVIGHSWGGYSTLNIPSLHPEITHVVALSPFVSPKIIQKQILRGLLVFYRKTLYKIEEEALPDYAHFDGRESLKNANTKALIIHSRDDKTCRFKEQFCELKKELSGNSRVEFLELDGKRHHPHYTENAVKMRTEYNAALKQKRKQNPSISKDELEVFASSYDWYKMTEQDEAIWQRIFEFFES